MKLVNEIIWILELKAGSRGKSFFANKKLLSMGHFYIKRVYNEKR